MDYITVLEVHVYGYPAWGYQLPDTDSGLLEAIKVQLWCSNVTIWRRRVYVDGSCSVAERIM